MPGVGLILLAAGCSERMGKPKQMLCLEGETLLRRAAKTAIASLCSPIIVVLGANRDVLAPELHGLDVQAVYNAEWKDGMASSIRTGMQALISPQYTGVDAVLLTLCDQPLITTTYIDEMVDAHTDNDGRAVASTYGDTFGVPALFPRNFFPDLFVLTANSGAKHLLNRLDDSVVLLQLPAGAIDVDTEEDYFTLLASHL